MAVPKEAPERTPDGRYIVVRGRRWRAADPALPDDAADALRSALGRARAAVRLHDGPEREAARARVQLAKEGLGERGEPWWHLPEAARTERARDRLRQLDALENGGDGTSD